jgi:S1-C subfamily serine protease
MSSQLIELSDTLAQATQTAAAFTVAVHTESHGSSSGVIWRPGIIVTAEHSLRRDEEIHITLPDGRVVVAALAGRDPSTDLAVLKCAEAGFPAAGAAPQFGDAATLRPGSLTLVVGRTRASGPVAALGVVSLVAPQRQAWTGASLAPYIRLDVSLQPTASGGAVVDARGQIVGIATPRFGRFGAVVVPAAIVNSVTDTLLQKGRVPRGYLGVGLQPIHLPDTLRQSLQREEKSAAIVLEVEPDGPANKAGIVIGDIIVALAGQQIARLEDVHSQLQGAVIGKALDLKIVRGGAIQQTTITVGERRTGGE